MKALLYFAIVALLLVACSKQPERQAETASTEPSANPTASAADSADPTSQTSEPAEHQVELPDELLPFVQAGYIAYDYQEGDLNGDKRQDYLLVLGKQHPETTDGYVDELLLVQLIVRQKDNSLKLHSSNHEALEYPETNAYSPDAIGGNSLGNGFIIFYGFRGMGVHGTHTILEYHFDYNKKDDQWYLTRSIDTTRLNNPELALEVDISRLVEEDSTLTQARQDSIYEADTESYYESRVDVQTSKDFGIIPFPKFRKRDFLM